MGRETELSKLQGSIASLNQELEALRERINTQELSPDDVKVGIVLTARLHPRLPSKIPVYHSF